jgi:DNA repair protein RadA/Sms
MKQKTLFYCTECGNEFSKWAGKCPACGAWNTIVEQPESLRSSKSKGKSPVGFAPRRARPVTDLEDSEEIRFPTGMGELDRVLGGGAVRGSLVLVGGAPGIGKSTLMLQICNELCASSKVLYVSGEESEHQLKLRAKRLHVESSSLFVISETNLSDVLESVEEEKPDVLIVDSIQTLYDEGLESTAGSIAQVKGCTLALMQLAKGRDITVFVIGHVNKEGSIAGPKVLEHMVDCVLYFEGEQQHLVTASCRAAKNRFGATNEIGVFEMRGRGTACRSPIRRSCCCPERPEDVPGTCVDLRDGGRAARAGRDSGADNAQRLRDAASRTSQRLRLQPRRHAAGRPGEARRLKVSSCDAYINVIGGLFLDEPAADLAAVVALASSYLDRPVPSGLVAVGEVGLTGELRSVGQLEQRISEIQRLGFRKCLIPAYRANALRGQFSLELVPTHNIGEALRLAFGQQG